MDGHAAHNRQQGVTDCHYMHGHAAHNRQQGVTDRFDLLTVGQQIKLVLIS